MDEAMRRAIKAELDEAIQAHKEALEDFKQQAGVIAEAERELDARGYKADQAEYLVSILTAKLEG